MKTIAFGALATPLILVAFNMATPAYANERAASPSTGECRWETAPQFGPRAPLRAPVLKCPRADRFEGIGGPLCEVSRSGKVKRYTWHWPPQFGPRAALRPPVRLPADEC